MLGPSLRQDHELRMVAGFEGPSEGRILLDGEDVTSLPSFKRPVEHRLPELRALPVPPASSRTWRSGSSARRSTRPRSAAAWREELERVGLAERGEAQAGPALGWPAAARRTCARAREPPAVLLLDEPLGALDLKLRKQLQVELKRIQRDVGITFVYVTHDQEEALTMSDRIAVMRTGVVEQVSDPEPVYERPAPPSWPASSASRT